MHDSQSQHDKIKRKALLQPGNLGQENARGGLPAQDDPNQLPRMPMGLGTPVSGGPVDMNIVVGGMEANGVTLDPQQAYPNALLNSLS